MEVKNGNNKMRTPEEGLSTGAGPGTLYASGQWRGSQRAPRRRIGDDLQAEAASAITLGQEVLQPGPSSQRGHPATPVQSASTDIQPATTRAGLPRQRLKWSQDMNIFIMRWYFKITKLGTCKVPYRSELHKKFIEAFPTINVSVGRIADQRRAIETKSLLPQSILQTIKNEVRNEITGDSQDNVGDEGIEGMINSDRSEAQVDVDQTTSSHLENVNMNVEKVLCEVEDLKEIYARYCEAKLEFQGMNPVLRPRIPKVIVNAKVKNVVKLMNDNILPKEMETCDSLESLHDVIYCASVAVVRSVGLKCSTVKTGNRNKVKPVWQKRIENRISELRDKIGCLYHYLHGKRTKRLTRKVRKIIFSQGLWNVDDKTQLVDGLDRLKQRLAALCARLARFKLSNKRKNDNKLFQFNEKKFYRVLKEEKNSVISGYPSANEIEEFWSSVWSIPCSHNTSATWIKELEEVRRNVNGMDYQGVDSQLLQKVIANLPNWKTPGVDKVHNFWFKKFNCVHSKIAQLFTEVILNPQKLPAFFTQGITYMISKGGDSKKPENYRPISCLPTIYKILTSTISEMVQKYLDFEQIIDFRQNGCRKGAKGCKELLVMDAIILEQAKRKKRNLHMAFVDYKKAYDSVPHSWLCHVLKLYGISPIIVGFLSEVMKSWRTTIFLPGNSEKQITLNIRKGIFQGDSLSPLWFCLAINPISFLLERTGRGYQLKQENGQTFSVTHFLYMDDIKLYSKNNEDLQNMLRCLKSFSQDISIEFGLSKCKEIHIEKGKVNPTVYTCLTDVNMFEAMCESDVYRYLGIEQSRQVEHTRMKKSLENEYKERLKQVFRSGLNGRNKARAINTYAVPVLSYSFGIIAWTKTDLEALQRTTRVIGSKYRYNHPRCSVERMTLPRKIGGRGILDIANLHATQVMSLRDYFHMKDDSPLHLAIKATGKGVKPLMLGNDESPVSESVDNDKIIKWASKELHGRHHFEMHRPGIDLNSSNAWLDKGDFYGETEGLLLAVQDQVLPTRNYRRHILKENIDSDLCRMCQQQHESIDHIIAGCNSLAGRDYVERHNSVAGVIHQALALNCDLISERVPYYQYKPASVLESNKFRLYWDRDISTDRDIGSIRPDVVMIDKVNKLGWLIDIAIPLSKNTLDTVSRKKAKYVDLAFEVKRMWKLTEVKVLPVVLSATGIIPESIHESLKELRLPPRTFILLQKIALLGTARIVRKVFNQ